MCYYTRCCRTRNTRSCLQTSSRSLQGIVSLLNLVLGQSDGHRSIEQSGRSNLNLAEVSTLSREAVVHAQILHIGEFLKGLQVCRANRLFWRVGISAELHSLRSLHEWQKVRHPVGIGIIAIIDSTLIGTIQESGYLAWVIPVVNAVSCNTISAGRPHTNAGPRSYRRADTHHCK